MKVIYINCAHRDDRRAHMEGLLSSLNLDYRRFEAVQINVDSVSNNSLEWHPLSEYFPENLYEKLSPPFKSRLAAVTDEVHDRDRARICGEIGCYLSHYCIHKQMLGNTEPYLVLEDDINFGQSTLVELKRLANDADCYDWDMLRQLWFSHKLPAGKVGKITEHYSNDWNGKGLFGGSHFTLVKSAETLVDYFDSRQAFELDAMYSTHLMNVYHASMGVEMLIRLAKHTDIPNTTNI